MSHLTLVKDKPIVAPIAPKKPEPKFDRHIERKKFSIGDRVSLQRFWVEDHVINYVNGLDRKRAKGRKFKSKMCYTGTVYCVSFDQDKGKHSYYVNIIYHVIFDNGNRCVMFVDDIESEVIKPIKRKAG